MLNKKSEPGNVMVVDDQPANLKLLEDILKQKGYSVRSFPRGRQALAAAAHDPPDLILLDINMPEMDGYEVCTRLKAAPALASIPVIFLSALDDTKDKLKAFQAGGVDYVSKPFQIEEVQARVETHVELHRLQRALLLQNEHLEDLVKARTQELAEAHVRLKILDQAKSDFLQLISHELRTPLNGIVGIGEIVLAELRESPESDELRAAFERSRERLLSMLEDALLLTQVEVEGEKFTPRRVPLNSVLDQAIERSAGLAKARDVMLAPAPASLGFVRGQEDLLTRDLEVLLEMAVKFSRAGETVRLAGRTLDANTTRLIIESRGSAIPADLVSSLFDVLTISEVNTPGGHLGLGPAVAQRVLSLFGGSVSVENQASPGIRLTIDFRRGENSEDGGLLNRDEEDVRGDANLRVAPALGVRPAP